MGQFTAWQGDQIAGGNQAKGRTNRKRKVAHDRRRYCYRHLVDNALCRLKNCRRVATRYDEIAVDFLSVMILAAIITFWI